MSENHIQEELLHRYFDGEVGERQAARVREHVGHCAECTAQLESLSKLHNLFAIAAEDMAGSVHSEALFARISDGVRKAPEPGLGERLRLWWDDLLEPLQPRGVWVPVTVAVMTTAAALLIVLQPGPAPAPEAAPRAEIAPAPVSTPVEAVVVAPASMLPSEIVDVDFGVNAGTIFEVVLNDGESTPVVWIEEDE